jgi:hypothetical protein
VLGVLGVTLLVALLGRRRAVLAAVVQGVGFGPAAAPQRGCGEQHRRPAASFDNALEEAPLRTPGAVVNRPLAVAGHILMQASRRHGVRNATLGPSLRRSARYEDRRRGTGAEDAVPFHARLPARSVMGPTEE